MTRLKPLFALGGLLAFLVPVYAAAQEPTTNAPESARIQLGPLGISPKIALTNLGVDTNVLNQSANPQSDFTATVVPGLDSSLRIGRGLLTGNTTVEFVYFTKTSSQRSIGFGQQGRFDLAMNAFRPYLTAGHAKTYRRPNAEIDARVGQTTRGFGVGANFRLSWRTTMQVEVNANRLKLEAGQFLGVNLSQALDRQARAAGMNLRFALTPLTTFVVRNTLQHDRFTLSPDRDTNTVSVVPGFEFKPSALIAGSAFAGYRSFRPTRADRLGFTGLVAAVQLGYVLRDTMRFDGRLDRDVEYSAEASQTYFLVTAGSLTVTQALGGSWDALLRAGRQFLDYQKLSTDVGENRRDRAVTYGTGVGYRLQPDARIGFDVNYVRRLSPLDARHYSGFQFGGSFRYGS